MHMHNQTLLEGVDRAGSKAGSRVAHLRRVTDELRDEADGDGQHARAILTPGELQALRARLQQLMAAAAEKTAVTS